MGTYYLRETITREVVIYGGSRDHFLDPSGEGCPMGQPYYGRGLPERV